MCQPFNSVLCILMCMAACVRAMIPSIQNYFDTGGDLTVITWAHAVNHQDKLDKALQEGVMMLEADVVLGTLEGQHNLQPVMAHLPVKTSDLSLAMFLDGVAGHHSGIKLDFKSLDALLAALELLQNVQMNFPVILNADILPGPVKSTVKPVDADVFLQKCTTLFPNSMLSVGWTTEFAAFITSGAYTDEHVEAMVDVLNRHDVKQGLTFPVRAAFAANSYEALAKLRDSFANSTFTIWSAQTDKVDVSALKEFIDRMGRNNVFVDVPASLGKELKLHQQPSGTPSFSAFSLFALILCVMLCYL